MVQRPMTPLGTARLGAAPNFNLVTSINSMPPANEAMPISLLLNYLMLNEVSEC
jgi:hypothetical protein